MRGFFTSPTLSTEEETRYARLFHQVVIVLLGWMSVYVAIQWFVLPQYQLRWAVTILLLSGVCCAMLALNRQGRTRLASRLLVGAMVFFATLASFTAGGIRSPGAATYLIIVMIASMLLGRQAAAITAAVCGLASLGLVTAEIEGVLPDRRVEHTALSFWIGITGWLVVVLEMQRLSRSTIEEALQRARRELQERIRIDEQLKAAAAELEKREAEFRAIFENTPIAITMVDGAGKIFNCNRSLERLLGYRVAQVTGKNIADLTHPEDRESSVQLYRSLVAGERSFYQIEKRYVRNDGRIVWGRLAAFAIDDAAGKFQFGVGMIEDVTARKKAEEEKKVLEVQLVQAQKMESIGKLAGGVAHDFNNLLTVIVGYSEMVLAGLPKGDPAGPLVKEMLHAGERASSLTRQLLAFSRKTVLAPKVLDVNELVANLGKMLRRLIGEDIQLTMVLGSKLDRVKADPGLLEQAMINLAVNARDAMPQGGRLTIETKEAELDEGYLLGHPGAQPGRYIVLAVTDTGCGIDPGIQNQIFEPFFTTKEVGKGTGLGLSMVYGFAKQSGGYVTCDSQPGKGASFRLYLPCIAEGVVASEVARRGVEVPQILSPKTILLVEDEEAVRNLAQLVLQRCGYDVLVAANGRQALKIAEEHPAPIHLLVSDVVMPELTGSQVAVALRPVHPETKVLFLSGYMDDAMIRHRILESRAAFLQKPFSPPHLASKVREVLEGVPAAATQGE